MLTRKRSRFPSTVVSAVVGAGAFLLLLRANPVPAISNDGVRDQLLARDCVELGECPLIGPATSVTGPHPIFQGAGWVDLLVVIRTLGGDPETARLVVLALCALSMAILCFVTWQWLRPALAVPVALLATGTLVLTDPVGQLINPSAEIFPDVLAASLLLSFALTGRRRSLAGAAVAVGVAINFHVASLALLPSLVLLGALAGHRPLRESATALLLAVAAALSTSWNGWFANALGFWSYRHLLPVCLLVAGLVGVFAAAGARFRALTPGARACATGLLLLLPYACGVWWLRRQGGHGFLPTYLPPVIAPGAALVAGLTAEAAALLRPRALWLQGFAAWLLVAGLAWVEKDPLREALAAQPEIWDMRSAGVISRWARDHQWSQEELQFRTQGPACQELVTGAAAFMPAPDPARFRPSRALRVFLPESFGTGDELARLGQQVARAGGDRVALPGGGSAVLSELSSWLRPDMSAVCHVPQSGAPICTALPARVPSEQTGGEGFRFANRAFPGLTLQSEPPYTLRYELAVVPEAPGTRTIRLLETASCDWRIVSVENLTAVTPLPASRVTLRSDSTKPGKLVLEESASCSKSAADAPKLDRSREYPPCLLETTAAEEGTRLAGEQQ